MSLTDDWRAGKLKNGWYFCLYENDAVFPALCFDDDFDDYALKVTEVLAPCDYEELKRVRDENNDLSALVTSNEIEIDHLCQLLEECKDYIDFCCVPNGFGKSYIAKNLLTRITKVLK